MDEVSLPIALVAGVVSFASPCFLPVVPLYIGYMAGEQDGATRSRGQALGHALAFVVGFTLVFVGLWLGFGLLGHLLGRHRDLLRIAGGIVLVLMGLHVARLIDIPFLSRQLGGPASGRGTNDRPGLVRSLLLGLAFGAGWTPCIGPTLGAIIGMASLQGGAAPGALLLVAYSIGLGLPFIAVALGAHELGQRLGWLTRHETIVSLASGALLVGVGFLMTTNLYTRLSA